jgi:hypothetical protein
MIGDLTVTGAAFIALAAGMAIVAWLIDRDRTAQDHTFRYGLAAASLHTPRRGLIARADLILADSARDRDWAQITGQQAEPAVAVYEMPHDDPALD